CLYLDSLLVRNGGDAELEPRGMPEAGGDDGEAHQAVCRSRGAAGRWRGPSGKTRMIHPLSHSWFVSDPTTFRYTAANISLRAAPSRGKACYPRLCFPRPPAGFYIHLGRAGEDMAALP